MEYANTPKKEKDNDKIYVRLSLSKYPFLKDKKHGDSGTCSFKAEIESSENDDEGSPKHKIIFHDLSNKPENVRV